MTTGEKIRQKRKELGITQTELAKLTGYKSKYSISKVEHDNVDLSQSKIVAFANALHVTPAYIMGWDNQKNSSVSTEYAKLDSYDKDNVKRYIEFLLGSTKYKQN